MKLFVDTSVWSLAFRRNGMATAPEVVRLQRALEGGEDVFVTGLVLQELLQGFAGPRAGEAILQRFAVLPLLTPSRSDHVAAAVLRNQCRRRGVQVATIDALLAQLCIAHALVLLSTDADFQAIARHSALEVWQPG